MAYFETVRAKVLELLDPSQTTEEICNEIALFVQQESGRSYWAGVQHEYQKQRRQLARG